MPAKQLQKSVPTATVPDYDEVLVVNTATPVHFAKAGEETPSGNLSVGDTLAVDDNGNYIKEEKYSVSYVYLLGGVVVEISQPVVLEGQDLIDAMGRNPKARNEIKNTAYDVLKAAGIIDADATIA